VPLGLAPLANRGAPAPSHRSDQGPARLGHTDYTRAAGTEHPNLFTESLCSTSVTRRQVTQPTDVLPHYRRLMEAHIADARDKQRCHTTATHARSRYRRWRGGRLPDLCHGAAPHQPYPAQLHRTRQRPPLTTGNHTHAELGRSSSSHIGHARAPCVLGCPETARHPTAPDNTGVGRYPDRTAPFDTTKHRPTQDQRTLNPRVRGSSPWRRTVDQGSDLQEPCGSESFSCPVWTNACSVRALQSRDRFSMA
jgi:hypothetical protein